MSTSGHLPPGPDGEHDGRRRRSELVDRLLARCILPTPDADAVCAYSGGADSTALLVLASAAGCRVRAVHVDHGLRTDSATDAQRAARHAAELGVECEIVAVTVAPGPNLEARARAARLAALPANHLTGHTADDQAETVLVNLLRGAGLDGLAAMRPGPRHPLLALRRAETAAVCADVGIVPAEDPSNTDPRHVRNRLRHEALPLLADIAGRDVGALLARSAAVVRDDVELLDRLAAPHLAAIDPTNARLLNLVDPLIGRRALRRWLTNGGYPPDLATLERAWAVVTGSARACDLGGGRRLTRSRQRLTIVGDAGSDAETGEQGPAPSSDDRH